MERKSPKRNLEVRSALEKYGVRVWELAERLGKSDSGFYAKLRRELPPEEQDMMVQVIKQIAEGR